MGDLLYCLSYLPLRSNHRSRVVLPGGGLRLQAARGHLGIQILEARHKDRGRSDDGESSRWSAETAAAGAALQ